MAYNSIHTGAAIDSAITKAQSVESGATANATDAQLRDRSTHTGTQDAATITGLAAVATSGSSSALTNDAQFVVSNPVGITGANRVVNHVFMSQAAYDALGSYDANTVYEIVS